MLSLKRIRIDILDIMIDMELATNLFIIYGSNRANFVQDILFSNFSFSLILRCLDDISFPLSKSQIDFEELLLTSSTNRSRWQRILICKPKVGLSLLLSRLCLQVFWQIIFILECNCEFPELTSSKVHSFVLRPLWLCKDP